MPQTKSQEEVEQIRGWINFNGTGTITIRDSFNVSGITDNGTGTYTITWDRDFADANYAASVAGLDYNVSIAALTVGSLGMVCWYANDTAGGRAYLDRDTLSVIAIGDQ